MNNTNKNTTQTFLPQGLLPNTWFLQYPIDYNSNIIDTILEFIEYIRKKIYIKFGALIIEINKFINENYEKIVFMLYNSLYIKS